MKEPSRQLRFKPAIAARAFRSLPPGQVIDQAVKLGASAIEWSETHAPIGQTRRAIGTGEATIDHGLSVAGYAAYWQGDPDLFMDIVNTATLMGAPTIRIGARAMAVLSSRNPPVLRRSLDIAHAAGITLSLSYLPASFDATLRLAREIAHPALRLYWRARFGWQDVDASSPLHGLRFCVSNVPLHELIQSDGVRASEPVVRARVLGGTRGFPRYTVFDAAPHGASIHRAFKVGA